MRLSLHIDIPKTIRDKDRPSNFCGQESIDWTSAPIGDCSDTPTLIEPSELIWVPELSKISARLVEVSFGKGLNKKFKLKLCAKRPDNKFNEVDCDGVFFRYKDGERETEVELLRGAMGTSYLELLPPSHRVEGGMPHPLLVVRIGVIPAPDRLDLMDRMVDEIVPVNPFLALSNFVDYSISTMRHGWGGGHGDRNLRGITFELEEISDVMKNTSHVLRQIAMSPESIAAKVSTTISLGRVRKFEPKVFLSLARKGVSCDLAKASLSIGVPGACRVVSYDTIAHRAIGSFLRERLSRLRELKMFFDRQVASMKMELKNFPDRGETKDALSDVETLRREVVTNMIPFFVYYLGSTMPWWNLNGRVNILTTPRTAFAANAMYMHMYNTMCAFEKKRFWPLAETGFFSVPRYSRVAGEEPSSWQKNYSVVYESWVFLKLMWAFDQSGYGMLGEYKKKLEKNIWNAFLGQRINDPVSAFACQGYLRVDVYYGVEGRLTGKLFSCAAGSEGEGGREKLTPDFVIVFTNVRSGEYHSIVLDAKSGREIGEREIGKRNLYATDFFVGGTPPDQSWLIYSGKYYGTAGIEFDSDPSNIPNKCWRPEILHSLDRNRGLTIDDKKGIVGSWKNRQPVGHVRANARTLGENLDNVFKQFVDIQIATARERLKLDGGSDCDVNPVPSGIYV